MNISSQKFFRHWTAPHSVITILVRAMYKIKPWAEFWEPFLCLSLNVRDQASRPYKISNLFRNSVICKPLQPTLAILTSSVVRKLNCSHSSHTNKYLIPKASLVYFIARRGVYTDQQGVSQTIYLPTYSNPNTVTERRLQQSAPLTLHYLLCSENL